MVINAFRRKHRIKDMNEERDKKEKKYLEVIFNFYNERKLLIAVSAVLMYVVFSVVTGSWGSSAEELFSKMGYHLCVAVQNVSITVFSVFILDFLISSLYEKQLKKSVADILTNSELAKNFIKDEREEEILKCSMDAILGERVSRKIKENILQNYRVMEKNCLRENVYVHIELAEDSSDAGFYEGTFTVEFSILGPADEKKFEIYYTDKKAEYDQYVEELSDGKRVLSFPFLMAKDAPGNSFEVISFKENGTDSVWQEKPQIPGATAGKYVVAVNESGRERTKITFCFRTKLNKKENYLFENVLCVCDKFHLNFNYAKTGIGKCSCYCSSKDDSLGIHEYKGQVVVNLDDIVLPGTFFILIWEI